MTLRRCLSLVAVATGIALAKDLRAEPQQPGPAPQPPPERLEPGRTVERAISAREVHRFRISVDSGSLVRVALTQRGIDLVVSLYGPDGAQLAEVDSSAEGREQEALSLARRTGEHRVEIRAFDTTASAGRYAVTVLEVLSPGQLAALATFAPPVITTATVQAALQLIGLTYTDPEIALLLQGNRLVARRSAYDALRAVPLADTVPPALFFQPVPPAVPVADRAPRFAPATRGVRRPANLEEVAFWPVTDLAALIRTRQVTSVELTRMFLGRLHRSDAVLYAVVNFTDSLALEQARRADGEIAAGRYRGPLHGIPYGVKDLYAVPGYPTTWGAEPYRDQVLNGTATAVRRLEEAGAVLVAKLATGALANGDVWFRERTRNPWNPAQGSSGSSAGPAAAVSAGLVPFALGTETLGSIVSPATTTGVTGLRPSYGRVSRAGVMALSWSMDKPGPLCRNAEDCALVFNAVRGRDPADPVTVDVPFPYAAEARVSGRRIGYIRSAFEGNRRGADLDRQVLEVLRGLGAILVPLELPARPVDAMLAVLPAEAAAAFDELTRSGRDSLLRRQDADAWPNTFRGARFIPAVEYLRANRLRRLLQQDMSVLLAGVDAYVAPSFEGGNLGITNLTGHPCVAVPDGFVGEREPWSITFCGPMYGEAALLEIARAYQGATPWDERHPPAFGVTR
jgi:Asp-tRNA(Asn)/Glu-tRNA(Gln) amidotransferase A subunit family amidase